MIQNTFFFSLYLIPSTDSLSLLLFPKLLYVFVFPPEIHSDTNMLCIKNQSDVSNHTGQSQWKKYVKQYSKNKKKLHRAAKKKRQSLFT